MPLCLSLLITVLAQVAPEVETTAKRSVLLLRQIGGVAVAYEYALPLSAGAQEIAWRPEIAGLKREEAKLSIWPIGAAEVSGAVIDAVHVWWALAAPADCVVRLSVTVPFADVVWSIQAKGYLESSTLRWRPFVTVEHKGSVPVSFDEALVEAGTSSGQPVSLGPLTLEPGKKQQRPLEQTYELATREVCRFQTGWDQVHRVLVLDAAEAAATLGRWKMQQLLLARDAEPPVTASVSLKPDRGAEVDLGTTESVVVRRKLLDERRENLDYDRFGRVQGLDTVEEVLVEAANYGEELVELQIVEDLPSVWEIKVYPTAEKPWADCAMLRLDLAPGETATQRYLIVKHSGTRIPQKGE